MKRLKMPWRYEAIMLTPRLAMQLKEGKLLNRKIIKSALEDYKRQVRAKLWELVPDSMLLLTADGQLLNGQHRIETVIETGIAIPIIICYGVPARLFSKIDCGRKWTAKDVLSVDSWNRPKDVGATAKIIIQYFQGTIAPNNPETNEEILRFSRANVAALEESILAVNALRYQRNAMAALHFLYSMISRRRADEFIRDFQVGNEAGTPGAVAKGIIDNAKAHGSRIDSRTVLSWGFVAWNAHFLEEQVTTEQLLAAINEKKYTIDPRLLTGSLPVPDGIAV